MKPMSHDFAARAVVALEDAPLQAAMARAESGFVDKRRKAVALAPEFEALRDQGREIKNHTLEHLDYYLECYEAQVLAQGGQVHWARTGEEATGIILDICRKAGAKRIAKGKSMVAEEMALNEALEQEKFEVTETDLGEYIIQLAEEPPSHIIAPAVHKTREQVSDLFAQHHAALGLTERQTEISALVGEARQVLRDKFVNADVGVTGANFLIAETGSSVLVTNEGNGDLTSTLPRVHIVTAGLEKLVPTLEDASAILRLLARSATGQEFSSYTTFNAGPRRADDLDGPHEYHVVLLDNGRSEMLGNEFRDMLRCIRCGACLNHCPVYGSIGGHAYGWVYPGPMGSVLTPLMVGLEEAGDLPNACTLNGRCEQVCPMRIPLTQMLKAHRLRQFEQGLSSAPLRYGLGVWAFLAKRPALYHRMMAMGVGLLSILGRRKGRFRRLPLASAWTASRDMPAPQGATFQTAWRRRQRVAKQ